MKACLKRSMNCLRSRTRACNFWSWRESCHRNGCKIKLQQHRNCGKVLNHTISESNSANGTCGYSKRNTTSPPILSNWSLLSSLKCFSLISKNDSTVKSRFRNRLHFVWWWRHKIFLFRLLSVALFSKRISGKYLHRENCCQSAYCRSLTNYSSGATWTSFSNILFKLVPCSGKSHKCVYCSRDATQRIYTSRPLKQNCIGSEWDT